MRVLKAADAKMEDLAFSPDGRAIAAGTSFNGIFLWNLEAIPPSPVRVPSDEGYTKGSLYFSSDGKSISWFTPGALRLTYNREMRQATSPSSSIVSDMQTLEIVQTPDGMHAVSRHELPNYRLCCWRLAEDTWVRTGTFSIADLSVENLTLSADGKLFAMLSRSALGEGWDKKPRQVEVHDAASAALKGTGEYPYKYGDKYGGRLSFSPDASQLVGFNNMNLLVWEIPKHGDLGVPRLVRNTTRKQFTALTFHPSGRHLYVTSNGEDAKDATVQVFDAKTWVRVEQFTWQLGNLKAIAISPDGALAAAGGDRGDIVIWDVDF